jgi:HEAT repeat protein
VYAPVHAWRALAQLRDEAAIEPLVRLMRERSDDDWVLDDLPRVLAEIGPASMDAVKTLLDDRDAEDNARMAAAASLVELATEHEELRPAVAQALRRRLSDCLGNTRYFNGALVNDLLDLGDRDSMPVIERAFAAERVDEWAVGTLANVRAEMLGQR